MKFLGLDSLSGRTKLLLLLLAVLLVDILYWSLTH